jgi:hypothetical protein
MRPTPTSPRPFVAAAALAGLIAAAPLPAGISAAIHPAAHPERRIRAVVTHCGDDGPGSLREAYANALDGAEIDLGQLACSTITLASGAMVDDAAAASVRIRGPAKDSGRTLTISGAHADRVFVHNGEGVLALEDLSIEAGRRGGGDGGCVYSHGSVSAQRTRFLDCAVSGPEVHGGAVFAEGDVILVTSSISGSSAAGTTAASGGAIHARGDVMLHATTLQANIAIASNGAVRTGVGGGVYAAGPALIAYSTLTGNHAVAGGAVHAYGLSLYDSTLSGNTAEGWGAGVLQAGLEPVVISNSTIAFNRNDAGAGAGIYLAGRADIDSTIIAGNTIGFPGTPSDIAGEGGFVIGADNLIQVAEVPVPTGTLTTDPMLDPQLQDNGGPTPTHALLPGSPAIDRGSNLLGLCCDQRLEPPESAARFERVVGVAADIGAYEAGAPDRIFDNDFDFGIASGHLRALPR